MWRLQTIAIPATPSCPGLSRLRGRSRFGAAKARPSPRSRGEGEWGEGDSREAVIVSESEGELPAQSSLVAAIFFAEDHKSERSERRFA